MKISAAIISYNEERVIKNCLSSIKNIVDEIVVVDSFSTDRTEEICRNFKVDIFKKQKFLGYKEQKSLAISLTSNDYTLLIDADEYLSERLQNSIMKIKNNLSEYDGYEYNRLNFYCKIWVKYAGWYPDTKLRLFNKHKIKIIGKNPHDKVSLIKSQPKHIKGDLMHLTYYSFSEHISQINRFSDINAQSRFNEGKKTNILTILLKPIFVFLKMYFLKKGFLEKFYGLILCLNSSYGRFLTELKLYELQLKNNHQNGNLH